MLAARTCADARHWFESKNWRPTGWHLISLAAHAHTQASTHASMHTHARMHARALARSCSCVHTHACTHVHRGVRTLRYHQAVQRWLVGPRFDGTFARTRARKHAHARTRTHKHAHARVHTCPCTHAHAHGRVSIQMPSRAHTCKWVRAHTHTHTCSQQLAANQQCALTQAARGSAAYGCSDTMKRWDFGWLVGPLS